MATSPFGGAPLGGVGPTDPNELLRRIDQTSTNLLYWVKILVVAVIAIGILLVLGV